ncbi:hypothetical protein BN2537_15499 [Streptomyces venezuelae]|nr:hypothetical protein BN2537_15499 [Streptomyces venezuelae]
MKECPSGEDRALDVAGGGDGAGGSAACRQQASAAAPRPAAR